MNWLMEFGLAHNMHAAVSILVQTFPYQSTNTVANNNSKIADKHHIWKSMDTISLSCL